MRVKSARNNRRIFRGCNDCVISSVDLQSKASTHAPLQGFSKRTLHNTRSSRSKISKGPAANGFTMVELLAATALSTLLFITAISVIRSLNAPHGSVEASNQGWTLAARQQLEWDFNNAVVFKQDDHGLILGGYGSLGTANSASVHAPVLVTYSLRIIHSHQWLVREQSSLDPLANDLNASELLCGDVKSFAITGSYLPRVVPADPTSPQEDPTPIVFQRIAGMQRLPDRVRVRIDLQNDSSPLMNTILYLR